MLKDKIKVLIITSRADYGGGPEHIYKLLKYVNGVEYFVACPNDYPYWGRFAKRLNKEKLYKIPHRKISILRIIGLIRFVRKKNIFAIHTHGKGASIYGRLVCLFTGAICIHTPHGVHVGAYGFLKSKIYRMYENLTSSTIKMILYVSQSEKSSAENFGIWKNIEYRIVNNGVEPKIEDTKENLRKMARQEFDINQKEIVVITVSRFDFAKNMYEAYTIAKICPNLKFLWIGDGEHKKELYEKSMRENIKNIIFTGLVDNPRKYYEISDLYLSTSRWEGMPLGVLEAMSYGLPIVASKVEGNKDIVEENKNGFLYKIGEIESAVSYIKMLANDQKLRDKMGSQSRALIVKKYSADRMAKTIEKTYLDVVND